MRGMEFWIYLLILAGSTYLIRAVPFAAVRKKIKNRFIQSFLHYIPYTVLTAMTIPAVLYATDYVWSAAAGLVAAVIAAWGKRSLTQVAAAACSAVFLVELLFSLGAAICL